MWKLILPKQSWWLRVILASLEVCKEYRDQNWWWNIPNAIFKVKIIEKLWFEQNSDGAMLIKQSELARYFWLITNFWWSNEKAITPSWISFLNSSLDKHKLIWILIDSMIGNIVSFWRNSEAVESSDSDIEPPKVFLRAIDSLGHVSANEYAYLLNELNDNGRKYDDIINEIQIYRKTDWSKLNRAEFSQRYIKPENFNKYFDIKFTSLFEEIWLIKRNEAHDYIFGLSIQGDVILLDKIKKLNVYNNISTMIQQSEKQALLPLTNQESLLLLSLLTKPFSILYWVSWTWKSRVVRELWKKLYPWQDDSGNEKYLSYFQKEAVPPNWFDDSEIIWRYNRVEWFIQWGFSKFLERAISDPENQYVYLLDEMNLSHVEQYFSQYLSAVEDLNDNNWWIHIWNTNIAPIVWEDDPVTGNDDSAEENDTGDQFEFDFNHPVNLSGKEFVKWILYINDDIISYERKNQNTSEFSNFHKLIIRYIVDNYNDTIERFWFKTLEEIKQQYSSIYIKWMSADEDIDSFIMKHKDAELGLVLHVNNEVKVYFYKGYCSVNSFWLAINRLSAIRKLVSLISDDALNGLHITFKDKIGKKPQNTIIEPFRTTNGIVKYYEDWIQVWQSLCLPKNLFVVGTINLDETTKSISPKVVDRANLIEFNDLDDFLFIKDTNRYNLDFLKLLSIPNEFSEIQDIKDFILSLKNDDVIPQEFKLSENNEDLLNWLYNFLKVFKLHFSYRTLKEILLFINIWRKLWIEDEDKLLDVAIIQKILPKLNWIIDNNFKLVSSEWGKFLYYEYENSEGGLLIDFKEIIINGFFENMDYSNSKIKLRRMQNFFNTYQNVNYFLS